MSGGVDSSVSAHLLRAAGHDVIGVFMRHGDADHGICATDNEPRTTDHGPRSTVNSLPVINSHKQGCCTAGDAADARRVADRLDIPFYALELSSDFDRIIDYFVAEYRSARTPNPCVVCNTWLKFGKLFDYADSVGAEFVATGHYARLEWPAGCHWQAGYPLGAASAGVAGDLRSGPEGTPRRGQETGRNEGFPVLRRGLDASKDQSYVLFGVDRSLLPRMMFPVGDYRKEEIRRIARQLDLRVADKKDSQEICFVTAGEHADFVRRRAGAEDGCGEIVTTDGAVVGRHEGIEGFTIGQRKGLGVALGEPRYVVRLEADSRRVVIGQRDELARGEFVADRTNWLTPEPTVPFRCLAQIRYNSKAAPAEIEPLPDGRIRVRFDEPQFGVAPGQAVVCYEGDRVLGGGWIE
jgi:tRNA-specific 2-thiouridylase